MAKDRTLYPKTIRDLLRQDGASTPSFYGAGPLPTAPLQTGAGNQATALHNSLPDLQGGLESQYYHFTEDHHTELGRFAQWEGFTDAFMQAGFLQQLTVVKNAVAGDRTLIFAKNPSTATTGYAQLAVEADVSMGWAGLVMFGSAYVNDELSNPAAWQQKALVYSSDVATGLMVMAGSGAIEFWLYKDAYPAWTYTHVADVGVSGGDVGLLPATDSLFVLGSETGPLRWKDGSFDQVHIGGYALTMEAASVLNQDLTTDAPVQFRSVLTTEAITAGTTLKASAGGVLIDRAAGLDPYIFFMRAGVASVQIRGNNAADQLRFVDSTGATNRATIDAAAFALGAGVAFIGEYQTQSGAWANPSGGTNGRIVTVYNSTAAATRIYAYSNGAWTYAPMS